MMCCRVKKCSDTHKVRWGLGLIFGSFGCFGRAKEFWEVARGLRVLKTTRNRTNFRTSLWRVQEQLLSQTIAFGASVISHLTVADLGWEAAAEKENCTGPSVSAMFCQCHSSKLLNIDYNICNVVLSGSCSQKAFQTGDNKVTNPLKWCFQVLVFE